MSVNVCTNRSILDWYCVTSRNIASPDPDMSTRAGLDINFPRKK